MAGCPIIRLEKHKTQASLVGAMGHHARTIPTKNADPERLHDNQVLWGTDDPAEVARRVKERTDPLVKRKDAVRAVELFLGASDEYWEAGGDIGKLARAHLAMLRREFGDDNVIGCGLHLDERKPHLWAIVTPVTPDGRLSAAHWFDGPKKLAALLDRAQADFAPLGLERARRGVKATHVDMQTIHDANAGNPRAQRKLARELARREKAAQEAVEEAEAKAAKATAAAAAATARASQTAQQLQAMQGRVAAIEAAQSEIHAERARQATLRQRLEAAQEAILKALAVLPSTVVDQVARILRVAPLPAVPAPTPQPTPEKRPEGPSEASQGPSRARQLRPR